MTKRVVLPKWTVVKRLPPHAVPITGLHAVGGTTVEQGFQAGRSRYIAKGYLGALNWFRIVRSSRKYAPLVTATEEPVNDA